MALVVDINIDQGSDFSRVLTVVNDNGTPVNLTGYTAYSQFRKSYTSTTSYQFATTVTNAALGQITIALVGSASSLIKAGRYLYDVEVVSLTSKLRVFQGLVTISPEVTKIPV